jgi:hypothetical protein
MEESGKDGAVGLIRNTCGGMSVEINGWNVPTEIIIIRPAA